MGLPTSSAGSYLQNNLAERLSEVRQKIKSLRIPASLFTGIELEKGEFHLAKFGGERKIVVHKGVVGRKDPHAKILRWFKNHPEANTSKVVASGILGGTEPKKLGAKLWLKEDIVPFYLQSRAKTSEERTSEVALKVSQKFNDDNSFDVKLGPYNEVEIAELVTAEDYEKTVSKKEWHRLLGLAQRFRGKRLVFFSATPQGGGVAIMRHALIRLFRLLGVDARWHVLEDRKEVFEIIKTKFHNILQGVASPAIILEEDEKQIFDTWSEENAAGFSKIIKDADVIVIDDPQPSGLVPHIKRINPKAKVIFRSHIHLMADLANKKNTPQFITWQFIWEKIKDCDLFISHPVKELVPKEVPKDKLVYMPPSTDPLDGLNKPLTRGQIDYYIKVFNKILLENDQDPLDPGRPFIVQIARFDPSKGIPDLIESYRILCQILKKEGKQAPQLVIAGNGSIDDPDGIPVYNLIMSMLRQNGYAKIAGDVKVARLPNYDQLLNALLRSSKIALQLSHREGFEFKITEALHKRKPVVIYDVGGMPLQVKDKVNGHVVGVGNTTEVAKRLYELLTDKKKYQKMSKAAAAGVSRDFWTVSNAINWLFLASELCEKDKFLGNGLYIKDLISRSGKL